MPGGVGAVFLIMRVSMELNDILKSVVTAVYVRQGSVLFRFSDGHELAVFSGVLRERVEGGEVLALEGGVLTYVDDEAAVPGPSASL